MGWVENCHQWVVISSTTSTWKPVTSGGCCWGSVLGPAPFNIFLNDQGDWGALSASLQMVEKREERALDRPEKWAYRNLVEFSKGKCQEMAPGTTTSWSQPQRRPWGSCWAPGWPGASNVPWWLRWPAASWAVLGSVSSGLREEILPLCLVLVRTQTHGENWRKLITIRDQRGKFWGFCLVWRWEQWEWAFLLVCKGEGRKCKDFILNYLQY